jgi:eukaryotic-like serine/threonine-protein kinase
VNPPESVHPPEGSPGADTRVGTLLGDRYLVRRRIGRGAMGVVYEAEHIQLKKRIAIKILRAELSRNQDVVQRFEREAVAAARIDHPGVVTASDFGELPDGAFYLVLEFVEGETLGALIRREGRLSPARALHIAIQINAALIAAHEAGIIHRDLKPDNVMLARTSDPEDFVKVLDFGIAKLADEATESNPGITSAGTVFGTPEYMAPEQARGDQVDARADLYALGMLLYEMLKGTSAFRQRDVMAILTSQMLDAPPPLPDDIPERVAELVFTLLAKEPSERPKDALTLAADLVDLAREEGFPLPLPRTNAGTLLDIGGLPPREDTLTPALTGATRTTRSNSKSPSRPRLSLGTKGLLGGVVVVALALAKFGPSVDQKSAESVQKVQPPPLPSPKPDDAGLLDRAASGERDALTELRRRIESELPETRDLSDDLERARGNLLAARRYLALGQGFSVIRLGSASLDAYQNAVKLDPTLASHQRLLCDMRTLLVEPDTAQEALHFAQAYLGSGGADVVYDFYREHLGQPKMTSIVARAQRIVKDKAFKTNASPALQVALALEGAEVCADFRGLLQQVIAEGDERSLPKVEALSLREGCGPTASEDCFACLRKEDVPLAHALSILKVRKAPSYLSCGPSPK